MRFRPIGEDQLKQATAAGMPGKGEQWRETLARPSLILGYSLAVALAVLAQIARIPLHPPTVIPFITYVPFIIFAAWSCGTGPGLLTAGLCTLECAYFAVEPIGSLRVANWQDWIGMAILPLTGVVSCLLFDSLRKARRSDALSQAQADTLSKRLGAIVDSSEDAIIGKDLGGVITSWNRSAERMFGYSAAEAIGQHITFFMDPRTANEELEVLSKLWAGETVDHYETRRRRKDGTSIFVSVTASPVRDASGKIVGASKIARDITERKKNEEIRERQAKELAIQAALLRNIVEHSPTGIAVLGGPEFTFELINPAYEAFQPEVAMKGMTVAEAWPEAAPVVLPLLSGVRKTQKPYHATAMPILRRSGLDAPVEERFFTFSYVPLPGLDGDSSCKILVVALDVTDMKRTELSLRESEERVRRKLDSVLSPEGDIASLELTDILDLQAVRTLLEDFYQLAHIPVSVMDLKGKVLVGAGPQTICTEFHWNHSESATRCLVNETEFAARVSADESRPYKCENNLWDIFASITVGDRHVGNLFSGPFFFDDEQVDLQLFRNQAKQYGFPMPEYLAAVDKVPRFSREAIKTAMDFFSKLANLVSRMGYSNIKLARSLAQSEILTKSLDESETKFRTLANAIPNLCWMANRDGWIFWYNERWYEYTGTTPQQMEGWGWQSVHDPEVLPKVVERWKVSIAEGQLFEMVFPLRGADGVFRPFLTRVIPIKNAEGNVLRWFGTNTDVTELRDAQEALRRAAEFNEAALKSIGEGLVTIDSDGCVTLMNPAAEELFGWTLSELRGKKLHDAIHHHRPDGRPFPSSECAGFQALKHGRALKNREDVFIRKDGTFFDAAYSNASLRDAADQITGLVYVFSDITERKRAHEQLQRFNSELEGRVRDRTAQLEASNRELEAFTYSVSHDLRAPLRGIDGWSLALIEDYGGKLDEQARGYLGRVRGETQRMGRLIDDLLRLSRVIRYEIKPTRVDLSAMANLIASRIGAENPERKTEFRIEPGLTAEGDPRLLDIALTNLLDNAAKFSSKRKDAKVEFGAANGSDPRDKRSKFFVRDNGAGFDMAYAGHLFGAFQRLHSVSEFPGSGIGLATVQRVILRHGGTIRAESKPNEGATFYFTIGGAN